jgi:putative hydrolase of the HAD superfamily
MKAVVFDFRDTIVNVSDAYKEMEGELWRFVAKERPETTRGSFDAALALSRRRVIDSLRGTAHVYDWNLLISSLLGELGIAASDSKKKALLNRYTRDFYQHVKLYGESKRLLKDLKEQGYKLGVVIDGDSAVERHVIDKFGLGELFDSIVISEEVGYGKITGKPLALCIKELRVRPKDALVIGDRLDKDIRNANRLGAVSVRVLRKKGRYASDTPRGDMDTPSYTISNLFEIKRILEKA